VHAKLGDRRRDALGSSTASRTAAANFLRENAFGKTFLLRRVA
jgi:hypothetical protein